MTVLATSDAIFALPKYLGIAIVLFLVMHMGVRKVDNGAAAKTASEAISQENFTT